VLWKRKANRAFDEIRRVLRRMATGLDRCMYCEDSEGNAIDHFWPLAKYPERAFRWRNYLWACTHCNSNQKRDRFPLDDAGQPLLIDPTDDEPLLHLAFSPSTGEYGALSPKGRVSIEVFGLRRSNLVRGRARAWIRIQGLVLLYAARRRAGHHAKADDIRTSFSEYPFASVFAAFQKIAGSAEAIEWIDDDCVNALEEYPEILSWS
jgi:uncharacterized protein (TIGR02646 family)